MWCILWYKFIFSSFAITISQLIILYLITHVVNTTLTSVIRVHSTHVIVPKSVHLLQWCKKWNKMWDYINIVIQIHIFLPLAWICGSIIRYCFLRIMVKNTGQDCESRHTGSNPTHTGREKVRRKTHPYMWRVDITGDVSWIRLWTAPVNKCQSSR